MRAAFGSTGVVLLCSEPRSVRRNRFCTDRSPFALRATPFGLREKFSRRSHLRSVRCNRFGTDRNAFALEKHSGASAGGIFASFATFFGRGQLRLGRREEFFCRSQLRSVRCNRFGTDRNAFALENNSGASAGGIFTSFATFFGRGQLRLGRREKFCVDRSCDRSVATVLGLIATHLRWKQLRWVRGKNFRVVRSVFRPRATPF